MPFNQIVSYIYFSSLSLQLSQCKCPLCGTNKGTLILTARYQMYDLKKITSTLSEHKIINNITMLL